MPVTKDNHVVAIPYRPNPKQKVAHGLSTKYRGFCGGWGNGKTTWGCVEFFLRLIEYPGTVGIISRKTRPELRSTTWAMFMDGDTQPTGWQGIPKELIKQYNKSDLYLELHTGEGNPCSKVHGLPLDDPKKLENYNLGLFWIDQAEEVEEDIALKFNGRLRQHNAPREGLFSFNPNGHNWLYKRFISPKRPDIWRRSYSCVEATPFDNPNLPSDYLEQFDTLPKHWYDRFVLGSHDVFVGQIFVDWDPETHVVRPFNIPSSWPRYMCIDPGIRHEAAAVWCAQSPKGDVFYYREHLEANQPVEWWAGTILEKESERDWGGEDEEIEVRWIGPEAQQRAQTDGKTVLGLYNEYGIYPQIADRDPGARISKITEYLRPRPGHFHPFRGVEPAPRLYVFETCEKLVEYLPQYRWRPQRTNFTEEDAPESVRKKDDHNIDCLGHILLGVGDDLPEVADDSQVLDPETKWADEHFQRELARATANSPAYRPGKILTTVG